MQRDDYDTAIRLNNIATALAKKLGDNTLTLQLTNSGKSLLQGKTQYLKVKSARDVLKTNPADPEANAAWGEYVAFVKGDFPKGLGYLAKGTEPINSIAKRDASNPRASSDRLAVADAWWELGDKEKDHTRAGMRQRAAQLYQEILPDLTGISATKAEKRIKDWHAELASSPTGFAKIWGPRLLEKAGRYNGRATRIYLP
ncbi:MAG: hypothetical protein QM811_22920 [Pirellulales bacterium]